MSDDKPNIMVGILGQWASGKSTAARIRVEFLGGEDEVVFLIDRSLIAGLALEHALEGDSTRVRRIFEEDGLQRIEESCQLCILDLEKR